MMRLSLAAAALAALTLGLTGCGGSENPEPQPLSKAEYQQALKYAECMKKYGVTVSIPDPDGGPPVGGPHTIDPNDSKVAAALAACGSLSLPGHVEGDPPTELTDRAVKMAECLRKQGIAAKDPEPGEIHVKIQEGPGDTPEEIKAAYAQCDAKVPSPKE